MKVINIHQRIYSQPKKKLEEVLQTLSLKSDQVWPLEKWPRMKFKEGFQIGAKGGHGPIRYSIENIQPGEYVEFKFFKPDGFYGIHKFELAALDQNNTMLTHTIDMDVKGIAIFTWSIIFRWLHDALVEDAFDKIENHFNHNGKSTEWSIWVKTLRKLLK